MTTEDRTVDPIGVRDADLQSGQAVGEYVVSAKIGEGGFGTVFRAEHPLIGKQVAIKVLSRQYSADPAMVARFVAEARAVNQIRHRNIIDIFGFGQLPDGRHYYVMEFLDGAPLDEYLERRGRLELSEAIPILRALARALDAAHAKGIAHRDLKPENVFLVFDEQGGVHPKLLDFGIAKLLHGGSSQHMFKTRTGAPLGTPYYMSPEQCRGRDVDHRTDVYAFGCVAYRILTGAYPFDGEDYLEILFKQINEEPAPPSSRVPSLPAGVDQGIAWMMQKDPGARPATLVEAVRALEEAAAAAGLAVAPDGASGLYAAVTGPRDAARSAERTPGALGRGAAPTGPDAAAAVEATTADTLAAPTTTGATEEAPAPAATAAGPRGRGRLVAVLLCLVLVGAGAAVAVVMARRPAGGTGEAAAPAAADTAATGDPAAAAADLAGDGPGEGPAAAAAAAAADAGASAGSSASAAPPDAAPAPPSRFVELTVTGPPEGTEVYGPGGLLGVAPGTIQLLRGAEPVLLTFKAPGHRAATREVVPDQDGAVEVSLQPARPRRSPRPSRPPRERQPPDPNSIEDPFAR